MELKFSKTFKRSFERQISYIAKDKPRFAAEFRNEVLTVLKRAAKNPELNRISRFTNRTNCRDVIYKGHTIVVRVTEKFLEILDIIYMQSFSEEDFEN